MRFAWHSPFSRFPHSRIIREKKGGVGSTTQQAAQADLDEENGSSTGAKTYLVAQNADHDHNIYTIAEAVAAINEDTASDDNIIQLREDITLKTTLSFYNNTTILGENHSITTGKYRFQIGDRTHADRKITFNLGQEGYSKTLTIKDGQPTFDLFEAQWCAADLNFYSGVTVENIHLDDYSVVILNPIENNFSMSFTMHGDSKITNCTSEREIVSLGGNNTMTMKDTSSISNCTAVYATVKVDGSRNKLGTLIMEDSSLIGDCTVSNSGNQCGSVYLFGGVLTMNDNSKISNCHANGGGGVYCWTGALTMNDNSQISDCSAKRGGGITICPDSLNVRTTSVQLNSGAVVNNKAEFGGGIYVYARSRSSNLKTNWSWTGTTVCNNTATSAGSDIYADTKTNIALPDAVNMNLAGAKGPAIDGWYPDAADARYDLTKHTEPVDRTSIADPLTSDVALVASHVVYDIEFTGAYAENCTAYNSAGKQITAAAANETVYLKYQDTDTQLNGWSVKNGDDSVAVGSAAALGSDYFVMPEKPVDNKVTVTPVLNYKVTVTGGKDYNSEGNQIAYAEPGDEVTIKADAPAAPADPAAADAPDAIFANWETQNGLEILGDATGSKVNGSAERELTFTMPSEPVSVTAVNQYKITIKGGKKYGDTAENEDGTYYYYAKAGDTVNLAFAGANGSYWNWNTYQLPGGVTDATDDAPAHFTMPANAVTIEASANSSPVTPCAYRVQVQLPADVAFAEDAAPVTVSVPDTTGTDENPKPDRTSTTALGAEPEQLVTLKFDAATLPEGYTFGQWVVTQLLPEQTTVEVTAPTAETTTFTMPASPVTVTFTVNAPVEPEPDPEPADDGGTGAVIAGALIGGTVYLLGTRAWLEGTYGYVPANRMELALGLWKRANCPAPVSTELYADIGQNDADAQAAARWCVEQGLLKDYHEQNDDGTETVTFKPGRYVARPYALTRWYQLEKLLNEQAGQ